MAAKSKVEKLSLTTFWKYRYWNNKKSLCACNHFTHSDYFVKKKSLSFQQDPYEIELLQGCLRGERSYQRQLYDRYKNAMFTVLYRMLGDEDDASDALQDAFLAVFKSLKNFQNRSTLGAWIKTIVVRTAIRRCKHRIVFDELTTDHQDHAIEHWDENLNGEYLEKGILELSPGYRSVFLLIEVEGYTHKETASMLGISEGTSKSQLSRAKKILQQKLRELMY